MKETETRITDKAGYAEGWGVARRSVDNWISQGLPHLKISPRLLRIDVGEADKWMASRFRMSRRATPKA